MRRAVREAAGEGGKRRARYLFLVGFWLPLIACTYLALVPEPPDNPVFRLSDILLHGAAFSYLSLALVLAHPGMGRTRAGLFVRVFALMLAYGLFLEVVQAFVPERSAELKDLMVDAAGITLGLVVARYLADPLRAVTGRLSGRL